MEKEYRPSDHAHREKYKLGHRCGGITFTCGATNFGNYEDANGLSPQSYRCRDILQVCAAAAARTFSACPRHEGSTSETFGCAEYASTFETKTFGEAKAASIQYFYEAKAASTQG
jgi:hypothetical protein